MVGWDAAVSTFKDLPFEVQLLLPDKEESSFDVHQPFFSMYESFLVDLQIYRQRIMHDGKLNLLTMGVQFLIRLVTL